MFRRTLHYSSVVSFAPPYITQPSTNQQKETHNGFPAPAAVLIRPDGYVAWVGESTHLGLAEALTTWFGPPIASTSF